MKLCPFRNPVRFSEARDRIEKAGGSVDAMAEKFPDACWAGDAHVFIDGEALDIYIRDLDIPGPIPDWLADELNPVRTRS